MSSRSIVSAASALILLVALVVVPGHAAAEKRIVVLGFEGPKASAFEDAVVDIVKDDHEYISSKRFARAAKKIRGFSADADGIRKVARRLKADGVVQGEIRKKGKRYTLTIKIRDGSTGDFTDDEIKVTNVGAKLKGAAAKKLKKKLKAALANLGGSDEAAEEEEGEDAPVIAGSEDEGAEGAGAGGEDEDKPDGDTVAAAGEEEGDTPEGEEKPEGDEPEAAVTQSTSDQVDLAARGRAIDVVGGLSFISRNLSFALSKAVADTPQGYRGALVPGVFIGAEVYPMALSRRGRSVVQNLGVSFEFERVLKINSKLENMGEVVLPTTQQRFAIGALYRWNFGTTVTSPTLKLGLGFGKSAFTIDKSAAPAGVVVDIPNVGYTYLSPGVELRFPITPKLAAAAEVKYLFVTALGEMQQTDQYGAAGIFAFDVDLGAEYKVTSSILARVGVRLSQFALTFDGSGALTDRDNDAMQDVSSATDRYLGIYALAGYLF